MPVKFDDYTATNEIDWAIDPDSNAYAILSFLVQSPETGFSPKEIHDATGISRGSVGTTLQRLADRGLVRHKEPYWAVAPRGIESFEALLTSLKHVEGSTVFDWGTSDPADYRVGIDIVLEERDDDRT